MKKSLLALFGLAMASALLVATGPAQARIRAGVLNCRIAPGISYVFGSQRDVSCTFKSVAGWSEHYNGHITRVGLDIGFTDGGEIVWAVFAPARQSRGALAGTYVGASGEASIIAGLSGNVLLGGSHRSIALQPLSVGAQKGFDLAVTASGLVLVSAP